MLSPLKGLPALLALFLFTSTGLLNAQTWRSSLYPTDWTPPDTASFSSDQLLQDFSYAGYRRGEAPIPHITGPVFDVTAAPYNADPSGSSDSTAAIQAAIDAAAAAGGGVVFLPAGTYLVEPQGSNNAALRIQDSDIVLRGAGVGETFILNTSYQMHRKAVIRIAPASTSTDSTVNITADLDNPTRRIPVSNASAFEAGDMVRLQWEFSQAWIDEHNQNNWWSAPNNRPAQAEYIREVTAVDASAGWIEVDVPTRYTIRGSRDNATVRRITGQITGVGIEDFSIGNVQHPGTAHTNDGFGESDYTQEGRAAWDVHASWLVNMSHNVDSWITNVHSYQPAGNSSTAHLLSNGIALGRCYRVTVANCEMRRAQYGGGGGNGYMYRVQHSHENLIMDSIADFSRHGFVISHAGTSGNVFLRCEDRETARATGITGSYNTSGSGSDHHMHFSHSNLFDMCHAHNSFYTAHHRRDFGTVGHALTSAHGVYWNTSGSGTRGGAVVRSEQGRYGYVIGTSGSRSSATNPTSGNTAPADILEGLGLGESLEPQSLYLDQLAKRQQGLLFFMDEGGSIPPTPGFLLNATTYSYGSGPVTHHWTQLSGPIASIDDPTSPATPVDLIENGTYVFKLTVNDGELSNSGQIAITVDDSIVDPTTTMAALESIDSIRGRSQNEDDNPLAYFSPSTNATVGGTGGNPNRTDWNVIYRYQLPTLPAGHEVSGFTFSFQISGLRDHNRAGYHLDTYLLDTDDAESLGVDLFYHGPNDPSHALVGSTFQPTTSDQQLNFDPPIEVSLTVTGDEALALLQSYYDGHVPLQDEVAFRFNLNQLYEMSPNNPLGGSALNRYNLDNSAAATGFEIQSLPTAVGGETFADWIAGFDVGGQTGFSDTPAGDGISNGIKAWFGVAPDSYSRGMVISDSNGLSFNHPQNPNPPSDMSARYEWSPDLTNWYSDGGGPDGGPTIGFVYSTEDDIRNVTALPSEAMSRIFFRLVVNRDE